MIKEWFINFLDKAETKRSDGENKSVADKREIQMSIYYKELALYTAITLIASAISKCEIKTYENNKSVKGKDYYKLNISPNINQNSSQFWHKTIEKMFYNGEALGIEHNDNLFCADSFHPDKYALLGNRYVGVTVDDFQFSKTFYSQEVFLFKLENVHLKKLIDGLYEDYGELLAYALKSYKRSNSRKYKLMLDEIQAGDEKFKKLFEEVIREQLKTFIENDNAVYPQFKGQDLQAFDEKINVKDSSDILILRKDIFELVGQVFKIPTSMMLGNITNMQEIVKVFLTFCIDPIADMISEELTRKMYRYEGWLKGCYIKVDTSTINHVDILDIAEKVDKLISSGTCCIDEVRDIIDLEALNTEFSKTHFITKNYDTVENRLKGDVKGEEVNLNK